MLVVSAKSKTKQEDEMRRVRNAALLDRGSEKAPVRRWHLNRTEGVRTVSRAGTRWTSGLTGTFWPLQ